MLGTVALLCGSATALAFLVVPLAIGGLVTGLAAAVRAYASGRGRWLLPAGATALSGAVLLAAVIWPAMLGPAYVAYRDANPRDPTLIHVVPLPGSPQETAAASPDWVDADRAALEQDGLRVQVVSAWTSAVRDSGGTPRKKAPPEERLFIRLRTQRPKEKAEVDPKSGTTPARRDPAHPPTLTDNTGRVYQERPGASQSEAATPRSPLAIVEEVFVFERPAPVVEYLRLELPAAGWGRTGAFRFTIPAPMIRR
jgi:hypothetical protein